MKASSRTPIPVARALSTIGEDLSTWRKLRSLTVAELADRAGVTPLTVSRLENGHGSTLETMLRITRALGVLEVITKSTDPYASDVGRLRMDEALPQRIRRRSQ